MRIVAVEPHSQKGINMVSGPMCRAYGALFLSLPTQCSRTGLTSQRAYGAGLIGGPEEQRSRSFASLPQHAKTARVGDPGLASKLWIWLKSMACSSQDGAFRRGEIS
jgi:hypothetical protein